MFQQPQPRACDASLPVPKHLHLWTSPPQIAVLSRPESVTGVATPTGPASATSLHTHLASTHRRSHSVSQRQGIPRGLESMFGGGGAIGINNHGQVRSGPAFTRMSTDMSDPGLPDQNS